VAVEVEGVGLEDPLALKVIRSESETVVALPEDGALAGVVDKDEGLLAGAAWGGEKMRLYSATREFGAMQGRGGIVANFADVSRAQSPELAGDHGGGDLASGENVGGAEFNLGARSGVAVNGNERVGGVQANADDVDFKDAGH
jgi:hypothetical protein